MVKRYTEVFDPNHSQECICHRGPMNRGLEESTEGDFVDIEDYKELKNQLAKANERVKRLEKILQRYESEQLQPLKLRVKELTKENLSIVNGVNKYSFEDAKVDFSVELNKFAIEKKIEALEELLRRKSHKSVHDLIAIVIDSYKNQLRKEQDSE